LLGIGLHRVQGNEYISVDACACGVIKGDDIGEIVVLEKLLVDRKDLLIVAEDIVEFAHRETMIRSYRANPTLHLREVDRWHGNIIGSEGDHVCSVV
jgi:hypothetical protein